MSEVTTPPGEPLSALPSFGLTIDEYVEDFQVLRQSLSDLRGAPHILDDVTVDRLYRLHTENWKLAEGFDSQLARWAGETLTPEESTEVARLQQQMLRYRRDCGYLTDALGELIRSPKRIAPRQGPKTLRKVSRPGARPRR